MNSLGRAICFGAGIFVTLVALDHFLPTLEWRQSLIYAFGSAVGYWTGSRLGR